LRAHPTRHSILRALGAGHQFVDPQVGVVTEAAAGDRILLCSDGLTDGLWDRQLEEFLSDAAREDTQTPSAQLVRASVERSGRDNTTALLVDLA
jgi:PPM family protein phosphatase